MDRKEIKKHLPYGSMKKIAKEAGVTDNLVYQFFMGRSDNPAIEAAAIKIALEYVKKKKIASSQLNELVALSNEIKKDEVTLRLFPSK